MQIRMTYYFMTRFGVKKVTYYLPLGKRYAVEAYYYEANSTIIALDGNKLKESSFWNCDEECFELAEITLDVKKL